MQGNNQAQPIQHPQQTPSIDFQIDLRAYSLCTYLKDKTNDMRTRIRTRRGQPKQPRYMTYRAEFNPKKDLEVFAVKGHEPLQTEAAANAGKQVLTAKQVPNVTSIILSISIDDLYPMFKGYRKINNPTNPAKQCYHAFLNGEKYTIVDLNYPQLVGKESRLTDWMGILISEQIRFDTLKVFGQAYGSADEFGVDNLFRKLFELFKVSVYNDWSSAWETKEVIIECESKEKKKVKVKKELKKGP